MTRRPLTLMLLAVALAGCVQADPNPVAPPPAEPRALIPVADAGPVSATVTATGRLAPKGLDGRSLLAVVSGWSSSDIHHVDLTLSTGGTPVTTLTIAQADLTNQVSFTKLKQATTYAILARACRTGDSSAPIDHSGVSLASCTTTFTTTSAKLNNPRGLALDSVGNLYIADRNNNCIRKVR